MRGKIIQIAGDGSDICALTSTGKVLRLQYSIKGSYWMDITPREEVEMSDKERELLNSLEEEK